MQSAILRLGQTGFVGFRGAQVLPTLRHTRLFGMGSHVSDNDPEVLEKAKERYLSGKTKSRIKDVPGWEEVLASESEAVVKAERSGEESIKEMQEQTVHCLQDEMGEGSGNPGGVQERR